MGKVAYRFLPCDHEGRSREQSQFTSIRDATETLGVGSVIEADLLGYRRWEVVEVREASEGLMSMTGSDGSPIPVKGTLVCRGVLNTGPGERTCRRRFRTGGCPGRESWRLGS